MIWDVLFAAVFLVLIAATNAKTPYRELECRAPVAYGYTRSVLYESSADTWQTHDVTDIDLLTADFEARDN